MHSRLQGALFLGCGGVLLVLLAAIPAAEASPRFTVANKSDNKLKVRIYNGDDGSCTESLKDKTTSSRETDTYGCQGNGKGRCKIEIYDGGKKICKSLHNTCGNGAIIMKDDSIIYIYSTTIGYDCQVQK